MLQYYLVIIRFSKRFMVILTSGESVNMSVSIHYYTGDIVPQDNVVFVGHLQSSVFDLAKDLV